MADKIKISSQYVLVELDDGAGVAIDRDIATGKGRAAWYIYGNRVCGWMPIPKTRRASAHQECGGGGE